jgi:hypothetical protein
MAENELSPNEIEYLSWKLMSRALEFIDLDLHLADLHPGGGQYDCLSLITKDSQVFLMLNRNGTSAATNTGSVHDIWENATKNGSRSTIMDAFTELDVDMRDVIEEKADIILTCNRMARWIRHQSKKKGRAICCWIDDTYFVGPSKNLLSQVLIPGLWTTQDPPREETDWSAWIYALTIDEKVIGLVNMKTGDAINPDGTRMSQWYEKKSPLPPKKIKKVESFAEPIENPTEEVIKIYRKVASFNGYNVFGDQLASVASSVAEGWLNSGRLPADIEVIKGALFFEFRRTHHTGQYPEGKDLLYVQALGNAIDEQKAQDRN